MTNNTFCYVEIPAPNIEKAGTFYRNVFNWEITPMAPGVNTYWMFTTPAGKQGLGGGFDTTRKPVAEGGPLLYLTVSDIPETLQRIEKAGGTLVSPRKEIGGGHGFYGVFRDPNGNNLGLWSQN
jgi:uncharacterized protein